MPSCQYPHARHHLLPQGAASLRVVRMKTGVSCRKSLAVYFLVVYRRTLSSLHLLRRVCKAASAALWTLTQGSCRSAWSPAAESIAEFSERRKPRLELCCRARLHVEGQLYVEVGPHAYTLSQRAGFGSSS